jgi:membrane fusion protein
MAAEVMTDTNVVRPALFRSESLKARQMAWQGRPAVAFGFPTLFTTLASVVLAAASAALITFGSYARRVDMEGAVLPNTGVIVISAMSPGRIETLAVKEGDAVATGALLYSMDVDTATKDGGVQQQILSTQLAERQMLAQEIDRKTRMSEEAKEQLRHKIETLNVQINQVNEQITFQQAFVKRVSNDYNQFASLVERHLVSLNELTARQQAWVQAMGRLQDLESTKLRLEGELKEAEYQLGTTAHTRSDEIDGLKSKILEIDQKLADSEAHRSVEIRAPEDGVVTAILAHPGQTVGTGSPMLKIVPQHAPMQAELLAPSSAVGFIQKGKRVLLRYSAYPYQKFGEYWGTVVNVSRAAMNAEEVKGLLGGEAPNKQTGPFYRIIVEPDSQSLSIYGEERTLPAGMQVHAYALLERRRLYEWILAPLYDLGRATREF